MSLPRRLHGPTPVAAWAGGTAVTDMERARSELAVERQRSAVRRERELEQVCAIGSLARECFGPKGD